MIGKEPSEGSLDDFTNGETKGRGSITEFCFIDNCDGTHEMDGEVIAVVVLHNTDKELGEAVAEETVNLRVVTMMLAKLRSLSEEAIGHWFAIDLIDNSRSIEVGLLEEEVAYLCRELALEDIAHQTLTDVSGTPLIA